MKNENSNAAAPETATNVEPKVQVARDPQLAAMLAVSDSISEKVAAEFDGLTINVNHNTDWETAAKIGGGIAAGIVAGTLIAVGVSYLMPSKGESTQQLLNLI